MGLKEAEGYLGLKHKEAVKNNFDKQCSGRSLYEGMQIALNQPSEEPPANPLLQGPSRSSTNTVSS